MKRLFLTVVSVFVFPAILCAQSIVQVTPLPRTTYWDQSYGLAADSTQLFLSSGTTTAVYNRGFIYKSNFSGVPTDSIPTGLSSSQGLAWDGTRFWYVRGSGSSLRIYKITSAGAIVDSILPPSSWYFGGACWDGTGLWVSHYYPNELAGLYKYDVVTKTIVDTIRTIGAQPQGIAWDGQYLYYVMDNNDSDLEKIYQVNVATGDTVRSWYLPEGPSSNMSPRGLAWDGHYLWMIAEPVGASSGRSLYKYDLAGSGTPDIDFIALVDFAGSRIGQQNTINVSLNNVGTSPLRIDSVRVTLSTRITATLATPITIQPGSSIQLPVSYTPGVFGSDTASIRIYSNDPDESTKLLAARGYGIYAAPTISAPTAYDFAQRRIGSTNGWIMTVQNQGGPPLSISGMTVGTSSFRIDSVAYPATIDSLARKTFRISFRPTSTTAYVDTLKITSNASNGPVTKIVLTGTGVPASLPMGQAFWNYTVPNNPRTSSNAKLTKGIRAISDINNDGKADVVVCSENYFTLALNGNASVTNDTLWAFNTYIANTSAGSIGSTGDYSTQKALAIADLNADTYKDVIIGTGGGNEHVYALNGRNGQILWQFGTDHPDSFSLGDITGVDASTDFSGDGIPDVIAAGSATETGGVGGRRSVYLFNGATGAIRWMSPLPGFTHAVTAIGDISGDGQPDVIGCVGEPAYKATAYSGTNGNLLWDFPITGSSSGAKEVLAWPVQGQTPDVIVSGFWGPIFRVDGESGTQMWSRPTNNNSAMQLLRLKDVTGDGVDEIVAPLLVGGAFCINGANGNIIWSLPTGNTMGAVVLPDLNRDGVEDVAFAVQNQGLMFVKGQDGAQLALYPTGTQQTREVALVPDIDGNNSFEVAMGGQQGNIALVSGGDLLVSVGENVNGIPETFALGQNYPNPFNPSTTINISVPTHADLTLTIFDVLGKQVKSFIYEHVPAGTHQIVWDGKSNSGAQVASGVYFYRLTTGSTVLTKQMLLLK